MSKESRGTTKVVGNNRQQYSPGKDAIQRRREQNRKSQQNYRRRVHNRLQLLDRVLQGTDANDALVEELLSKPATNRKSTSDIDTEQADTFNTDQTQPLPWSTQVLSPRSLNGNLWPCEDQELRDGAENLLPALSTAWNPPFTETAPMTTTLPSVVLPGVAPKDTLAHQKSSRPLIEDNPVPNDDIALNPILYDAALHGRVNIVRILLDQGADLYMQNSRGRTALHAAAQCGNEAIAGLLLDHGIDVDIRDNDGSTALRIAAVAGSEGVAKLLIGAGAQLDQ